MDSIQEFSLGLSKETSQFSDILNKALDGGMNNWHTLRR